MARRKPARFVLEEKKPLSKSIIWTLQRNFFDRQGAQSWTQGVVPHHVTSNPFIARAYAQVVFGWLRDWRAGNDLAENPDALSLDLSQPVYIIELGCGSGRFGYLFLKVLLDRLRRSALRDLTITYVLTDFTELNLDVLRSHPLLQPFVETGSLDFARFDAEHDHELQLSHSGKLLSPETVKNPMVMLANYFFDSIPQDVFHIREGQLYEGLITTFTPEAQPDVTDPELVNRVEIEYEYEPTKTNYYDDSNFNDILRAYQEHLTDTVLVFPVVGLRCIRLFRHLSGGRLLLLSGDKGYSREEALQNVSEPAMIVHGSVSMMVNYHAIGQYFLQQGGQAFHPSHHYASLSISAFLLGLPHGGNFETRIAYEDAIEKVSPDDFFTLYMAIGKKDGVMTLEQILARVRFSGWDHHVFLDSFPRLRKLAHTTSATALRELSSTIQHVWDTYFPIREQHDLALHLGVLLCEMQCHAEALVFFEHSVRLYGQDRATALNKALCYYYLGQRTDALQCVNQALELDADFEPARALKVELENIDESRQP